MRQIANLLNGSYTCSAGSNPALSASRLLLSMGAVILLATACVERKLLIRSEPSGATVFLDGTSLGPTPVEVPFTYYGTRELVFRKKDYLDRRTLEKIDAPIYVWCPLDFIFENLIPVTLTDVHEVSSSLELIEPRTYDQTDVDRSIERARALREAIDRPRKQP